MNSRKRAEWFRKIGGSNLSPVQKIFCKWAVNHLWAEWVYGHFVYDGDFEDFVRFGIRHGFIEV